MSNENEIDYTSDDSGRDPARETPNSGGKPLRIAVVEDDKVTRDTVVQWISQTPGFEVVGAFEDAVVALGPVAKLMPDVVLVDVNMPGMSGIDFVSAVISRAPGIQCMMLTVYGDTEHIFQALAAGASGYLLKTTLGDELVEAIREVYRGGSPMTSDVARKVVQAFHRPNPVESGEASLSSREKEVLEMLAMGYLYKEIAQELKVSMATVSTFVRRIYIKLQVNSRAQAVAKAKIGMPRQGGHSS